MILSISSVTSVDSSGSVSIKVFHLNPFTLRLLSGGCHIVAANASAAWTTAIVVLAATAPSCVAASSTPASIQNGINFLLCSGNILRSVPQNFQLIFLLEPAEILHEYLLHGYEYYEITEQELLLVGFWVLYSYVISQFIFI